MSPSSPGAEITQQTCINTATCAAPTKTDRQTGTQRQKGRLAHKKQTGRLANKDRKADWHTKTDRQTGTQRQTGRLAHKDRQAERPAERQTQRQNRTDRQASRLTGRQTGGGQAVIDREAHRKTADTKKYLKKKKKRRADTDGSPVHFRVDKSPLPPPANPSQEGNK